MENVNLADLNLSLKESRGIIEFLARKRNIKNSNRKSNDKLLNALKENNQQQKIKSKNQKRVDIIRKELKESSYKLSRSELKETKKNLYNIEKRNQFE